MIFSVGDGRMEVLKLIKITPEIVREVQKIVNHGNTAEVKSTKGAVIVLEAKRDKKISVPVSGQG